jgi:hypothetical protein
MSAIYLNRSLCAHERGSTESCDFAQKALACAYEAARKRDAQGLIDRFCGDSEHKSVFRRGGVALC